MIETSKRQPQLLKLVPDGDPVLRDRCRKLSRDEILSANIQNLVDDICYTSRKRKTGVGLSANQVGESVAISIIDIKPTPARPNLEAFNKVCINTEIIETFGEPELMWEGCQSVAKDENGEPSMALVPRFTKVRINYLDENGNRIDETVEGFIAHVVQHETDHLNGMLFADLVDASALVTYRDYCVMGRQAKTK